MQGCCSTTTSSGMARVVSHTLFLHRAEKLDFCNSGHMCVLCPKHRQHTLITDPLCAEALTPAQLTIPLPCAGMSGREALTVATQGGAKVLGRDDIGRIAAGMAADFVAWRTDCLCFSGAQHDLIAALVFCTPGLPSVDLSVINGDVIVKDGHMLSCNVKVCGRLLSLLLLLSVLLSSLLSLYRCCCRYRRCCHFHCMAGSCHCYCHYHCMAGSCHCYCHYIIVAATTNVAVTITVWLGAVVIVVVTVIVAATVSVACHNQWMLPGAICHHGYTVIIALYWC